MRRLFAIACLSMLFAVSPARATTELTLFLSNEDATVEDVFRHGLEANGENYDPIAHATGASCTDDAPLERRSAYLTLTGSEAFAQNAARSNPGWTAFRIYRVRPDLYAPDELAVFDVLSAISLLLNDSTLHLRQRSALRELLASPLVDHLYMARDIPGMLIHSADHYLRDPATGNIRFVRTQLNPDSLRPRTVGARQAFLPEMIRAIPEQDAHRHAVAVRAPDGSTLSVCLLSGTTQCRYDDARNIRAGSATCLREPLSRPGDLWSTVNQVILGD